MSDFERDMSVALGIEEPRPKYTGPSFMRPVQPSALLAPIVGDKVQLRTDVTRKLWEYIKRHKLQDKKNRRMINANKTLRPLFNNARQVSMFELTRLVNKHLLVV